MEIKFIKVRSLVRKRILFEIMRTFIFLLCTTVFAIPTESLFSQEQVTIDSDKEVVVDEVFNIIQEQTKYRFLYPQDLFLNAPKVQLKKGVIKVSKLLKQSFSGNNLKFELSDDFIIRIKKEVPENISPLPDTTIIQGIQIQGNITDESGMALPGANILEKGTSNGTQSDFDGNYSLTVKNTDAILVISFIGFVTQELKVNNKTTLNIILKEDAASLDEIVVVGYGTQKKRSVTSAISEIDSEELAGKPMTDIRQMMQGVSPGLSIVDSGGGPGENNIAMKIRGNTSIGETEPLVLIDGIEQRLSDLNTDNIASISVLKDASATAIYGSRAANGVILVTSKTPQASKLTVSYNGSYGFETPTVVPKHLGVEAYMRQQNIAEINAGGQALYTEAEIENYVLNVNQGNLLDYPLPNSYFDAVLQDGPIQNHQLAIAGGSEKIKSRLAVQLLNQDGILPTYNLNRLEVRLDNTYDITDWARLQSSLTFRRKNIQKPFDAENVIFRIWHGSQWGVPQYPNGSFGMNSTNNNPLLMSTLHGSDKSISNYFIGNFKAEFDITKDLNYSIQFGSTNDLTQRKRFKNKYTIYGYDAETMTNTNQVRLNSPINSLQDSRNDYQQLTLRHLLNYSKTIDKNSFNILAGYEQIWTDTNNLSAYRQEFYSNDLDVISAGSLNNFSNSGNATEERLRSAFGRIHYSYDDRYMLEANIRYDGSSKFFGSSNQYGIFPSFSGAWGLGNEKFWEPIKSVVSDLKIRGSWGIAGNNSVALYTFFPGLNIGSNYTFGGNLVTTASATGLVNSDLTWEKTYQTDFGIDAELWKGILSVSFDVWNKRTEDILLALPISATVGFEGPPQNAGRVDNKGWDLAITHRKYVNDDFNYTVRANLSDFRNKVVNLAGTGPYIGARNEASVIKEGYSLNSIWGYKSLGLFQTEEEIDNYPTYAPRSDTFPGDMKYEDLNNDGEITPDDKTIIGSEDPHYSYGLDVNLQYKNFDFSFFLQGVGQQDRVPVGASIEAGNWLGYTLDIVEDYYTPENPDAFFPRPQKRSRKNNTPEVLSSRFVIDASYIRLKNIQLGYTLPPAILEKMGINNLRFYISGSNVFDFSKAKDWGLDPEFRTGRLGYYYQTSQYVVGVNLSL
tara:strand:+ start:23099 stop:26488 length:3390 start_codon:yes stop_codon:yes gene_type:complete